MRLHVCFFRFVIASQLLPASMAVTSSDLYAQAKVFNACYVPLTGTVYRIKEADIKQTCASTAHVEFTWTDGIGTVRIGGAAAGDLSGLFPNPTVAALLGRALSTTPPTAGQVLSFDGTRWVPTTPSGSGGGASDHGALTGLTNDHHSQYLLLNGVRTATDGFAVRGTLGTVGIPMSGAGARLMWVPGKAAFRVGEVTNSDWDYLQIGEHSVAMGFNTYAFGRRSTALGEFTSATGPVATALGHLSTASGPTSTAMGNDTEASGTNATAMGDRSIAAGFNATAMGAQTIAIGTSSTTMGSGTVASGIAATAMGSSNLASGDFSTAMGSFVSTNNMTGTFVYGDRSTTTRMDAGGPNEFIIRAAGGTYIFSNAARTSGVFLNPGSGAWGTVSDVNRKHHFRDEDAESALEKIAAMPIRSWSYKSQDPSIRHLGPTAQDFYRAFRLGESDTTITTTDIDGVTLLAVKALESRTVAQARELEAIRAENALLREKLRELDALRARFERMERDRNQR